MKKSSSLNIPRSIVHINSPIAAGMTKICGEKVEIVFWEPPNVPPKSSTFSPAHFKCVCDMRTTYKVTIKLIKACIERDDNNNIIIYSEKAIKLLLNSVDFDLKPKIRNKDISNLYFLLGQAHYFLKNVEKAIYNYNMGAIYNPENYKNFENLGAIYQSSLKNDLIAAERCFKQAITASRGSSYNAYYNLGVVTLRFSEYWQVTYNITKIYEAIQMLDKAIAIDPKKSMAYSTRSIARKILGQLKEAESDALIAIKLSDQPFKYSYLLGTIYLDKGESLLAKKQFEDALQTSSEHPILCYLALGRIELDNNNLEFAEQYMMKVLEINPDEVPALLNMITLKARMGEFPKALDYIDKALSSTVSEWQSIIFHVYIKLAQIMANYEYYPEAALACEKVIAFFPITQPSWKTNAYIFLGHIRCDQGQYTEAIIAYQKATQWDIHYRRDEVEKFIDEIRGLKNTQDEIILPKRSLLTVDNSLVIDLKRVLPVSDQSNLSVKNKKPILTTLIGEEIRSSIRTFELKKQEDGLWYLKNQQYSQLSDWKLADSHKLYNFVIILAEDNREKIICGKIGHYYLGKSKKVQFAGSIFFRKGKIIHWNNRSGHYKPIRGLANEAAQIVGLPIDKFFPEDLLKQRLQKIMKELKVKENYSSIASQAPSLTAEDKKLAQSLAHEFKH